ncbi:MAG: hypothetical protein M1823_005773, partial [Watsoniomyces obsoletus]
MPQNTDSLYESTMRAAIGDLMKALLDVLAEVHKPEIRQGLVMHLFEQLEGMRNLLR